MNDLGASRIHMLASYIYCKEMFQHFYYTDETNLLATYDDIWADKMGNFLKDVAVKQTWAAGKNVYLRTSGTSQNWFRKLICRPGVIGEL